MTNIIVELMAKHGVNTVLIILGIILLVTLFMVYSLLHYTKGMKGIRILNYVAFIVPCFILFLISNSYMQIKDIKNADTINVNTSFYTTKLNEKLYNKSNVEYKLTYEGIDGNNAVFAVDNKIKTPKDFNKFYTSNAPIDYILMPRDSLIVKLDETKKVSQGTFRFDMYSSKTKLKGLPNKVLHYAGTIVDGKISKLNKVVPKTSNYYNTNATITFMQTQSNPKDLMELYFTGFKN